MNKVCLSFPTNQFLEMKTLLKASKKAIKILTPEQFNVLDKTGEFAGTPKDLKCGFIHLSYDVQVTETIFKHFRGYPRLYLVEFQIEKYFVQIVNGYPHVYNKLLKCDILSIEKRDFNVYTETNGGVSK